MTQKHNHAKAILLALLLVLGMIVSPVSALGYQITAEPLGGNINLVQGKVSNLSIDVSQKGDAVQRISVDIATGTIVNYTLTYGSGSTVSGWMEYRNSTDCADLLFFYDGFCQYSGVAIDTDIQGYSYRGYQEIGRIDIIGYARNWTSDKEYTKGIIIYDTVFGISERKAMAYYIKGEAGSIYKFQISTNKPVAVAYYTNTKANVDKAADTTPGEAGNEWLSLALKYAGSAVAFIAGLFWILKFFFIDNLLLIIALWISVSMAYSAITSPNIWGFYKKFFKTQKALLDFILSLWTTLWSILNYLVQIFVKWL
jgi:putative sterol carrier protein